MVLQQWTQVGAKQWDSYSGIILCISGYCILY